MRYDIEVVEAFCAYSIMLEVYVRHQKKCGLGKWVEWEWAV
jgi:hypothetical protein